MSENEQKDVNQTEPLPQEDGEQNAMIKETKNPPQIGAVIIISCFFLLVADLIAATLLVINGIYVGAIVCAALFVGVILSGILAAVIDHKKVMRNDIRTAKKITNGKITRCTMSNMTEYSVEIVVDGKEYVVSSKESYETDDEIMIAIFNKKRARIITDEKELEKLNEPIVPTVAMHHHHPHHHHHHHH